ncbi:MAG: YihY/virulence factor BrkB family protein [Streptosporangiales bacterium]
MNPIEKVIRRVDAVQQRHKATAFVFGLIKKYGDDNGGVLVANLAHSGFVSLFPLLLVLVTLVGLVASNDPVVRHQVLKAVAHQFPIIGDQLAGRVTELRRSSIIGLVVGLVALTWGATGLAQAGLFTMGQVWNLPGPARPGYFPRLGRALVFLGVLGAGVAATTLLTSLGLYGHGPGLLAVAGDILVPATNVGMFFLSFRVLTPKAVPTRRLVPGAVLGGLAWTVAQALGTYVVGHFRHTDAVYGAFATVLVLMAWISLSVEITVYAAELNVVLARRLWPRSIVQPPLTEADRAVLAAQALQNQRRDDQRVHVSYDDLPPHAAAAAGFPRTPDEIVPAPRPRTGTAKPDNADPPR